MINRNEIIRLSQEGLLEESIQELYDQAPCGYFSVLPDGTFIKINNTFLKWLGYEVSELLYVKKLQDLLSVGDAIYYETHFFPLLQMQGFLNEINFSLRCSNGRMLPTLLNTVLVRDTEDKPALFRTTVFDITDRKKYELELMRAKIKAEEAARVKAEFLSTVSHEIRTPINAIVGMVHLMGNTPLTAQQAEYLSVLELSTDNLLKLINNVLDFSKIEAGKVSLDEESVNIRDLVNTVLHGFTAKAEEKGLVLKYEIDERVPETLEVDALKLVQVLNNLISNAIKFTDKGQVALKMQLKGQVRGSVLLYFEVADTGIGIPASKLDLIFEEFAQANSEINRTYGGTGLGLAISQRLLGLYNSVLQVESEPGKGSRFFFNLSLKIGKEAPRKQHHTVGVIPAKGLKLLLVEDNKINVYVLSQYLQNWGIAFDVAHDGQEALEQVVKNDYDLILMDLQMPVMDGYEATRRIRSMEGEKYKRLPIIALTASAKVEYEGRLAAAGMDDLLAKPFNPDILYNLIASHSTAKGQPEQKQADQAIPSFDLSTFNDLMADDPVGMLDLINITMATLKEAGAALAKAIQERDAAHFQYWAQKLETSLELLQAKQLQDALVQGAELLKNLPETSKQLEEVEHTISEQFRLILAGLEERLKAAL